MEVTINVVEQDDLKNALRHAMDVEFKVSRSELHKGPFHEAAKERFNRYVRLYVKLDQADL